MNLSIFTKGLILIGIALAFHLGLLGIAARLQWEYRGTQRWSNHSRQVIRDIQAIDHSVIDADTGVRRFVVKPLNEFLDPYKRAARETPEALRQLRDQVSDNPDQSARAERIANAAEARLAWMDENVRLVQAGKPSQAVENLVTGEDVRLTNHFRDEVKAFLVEEHRLGAERDRILDRNRDGWNGLLLIGGILAVFVMSILALVFWRGISRRFATLTATVESLAKGQELPPALAGRDEIARVDRAFRAMAAELACTATELRKSAQQTRDLYDLAPCGYHSVDATGKYVAMNQTELKWLGFTEAEVVGRMTGKDILSPASQETFDAALATLMERGSVYDVEYDMVRKDGTTLPVLVHATAIRDSAGNFIASRSTVFDNTERRRAEAEIRRLNNDLERRVQERTAELAAVNRDLFHKNQENEMFVYSVSHDLRSPLVNLQGFSGELEKSCRMLAAILADEGLPPATRAEAQTVLDGKMAKSLEFIKTAVLRLGSIIDALLRLSRAGRVEYRWELVDVNPIVATVVGAVQGTIQNRGATVTVGKLPPILSDRTALEQVFANLIANALEYLDPARPGLIEIGERAGFPSDPSGSRVFYVKDNGLGIAAAHQQKIFQVFQRAHPGVGKGEGIGLAIVARVVERHHGRIWVESTVGEGSTFFVALPERV